MPPVYKHVNVIKHYDGSTDIDFRDKGLQLIYKTNVIDKEISDNIFKILNSSESPLSQHIYNGNFNRVIKPARLTYADVPDRPFYRYKGKPLIRNKSSVIKNIHDILKSPFDFNATIINGYRYNGDDCIAPHVDDEKFLEIGNYPPMNDISCVFTYTFLNDPKKKMIYRFGDAITGKGYSIEAEHGSLIIQGPVLHEVDKKIDHSQSQEDSQMPSRISITLRKLREDCHHGIKCCKFNCPYIYGPSNYLYYCCNDCLSN
jgi:hypothetical protein